MSEQPPQSDCTPTDPSLEYDLYEMVRLRVADALERRGHNRIEAERAALYLVEVSRPVANFLKVLTRIKLPEDAEMVPRSAKSWTSCPPWRRRGRCCSRLTTKGLEEMTDFVHGMGTGVWIGLLILNVVRRKKGRKK